MSIPPPVTGIYVHVPFCARRCGYCAFATVAVGDRLDHSIEDRFISALLNELELVAIDLRGPNGADHLASTPGAPLTLYLGGGTPSMLSPRSIGILIAAARSILRLEPGAEITIEANPDGLRPGQLHDLREAGVNRVSFGFQSVRPSVLALLDRTHNPQRALDAVAEAQAAGFEHISLDLIHGTPGETPDDYAASLQAAIDSGVDHVSAYALGIESGTKLAARVRSGELPRPDDDEAADRYLAADAALSAAGFEWYELSNWARSPEARSRHNLIYWRNQNWIGLGPSAHSHLDGVRWRSPNGIAEWTDAIDRGELSRQDLEVLADDQRLFETVMVGMRLAEGLATEQLDAGRVDEVVGRGLGERFDAPSGEQRLRLTLQGRLLADSVVLLLTD